MHASNIPHVDRIIPRNTVHESTWVNIVLFPSGQREGLHLAAYTYRIVPGESNFRLVVDFDSLEFHTTSTSMSETVPRTDRRNKYDRCPMW